MPRPKGVPNKKTAALIEAVEATGATPLQVMLENMRLHHEDAKKHLQAMKDAGTEAPEGLSYFTAMSACYARAQEAAKDAAPYIHPKLANIEVGQKDGKAWIVALPDIASKL